MYYHIRIDYYDSNIGADRTLFGFDFPSEKAVLEEVAVPYLCKREFLFQGAYLNPKSLRQVQIFQSQMTIDQEVDLANSRRRGNFSFTIHDNDLLIYSAYKDYVSENTRYIMNKARESAIMDTVENNAKAKTPLVFISHNSKDIDFVESLTSMLEGIGLDKTNLFCSSVPSLGVKLNEDIFDTLRGLFEEHNLYVIFVLSPNFYESPVSLNEMGAAWVLHTHYTLLLTKEMDFSDVRGVVNKNQLSIAVKDKDLSFRLNALKNSIVDFLGLPGVDNEKWERYRNKFIKNVL